MHGEGRNAFSGEGQTLGGSVRQRSSKGWSLFNRGATDLGNPRLPVGLIDSVFSGSRNEKVLEPVTIDTSAPVTTCQAMSLKRPEQRVIVAL